MESIQTNKEQGIRDRNRIIFLIPYPGQIRNRNDSIQEVMGIKEQKVNYTPNSFFWANKEQKRFELH